MCRSPKARLSYRVSRPWGRMVTSVERQHSERCSSASCWEILTLARAPGLSPWRSGLGCIHFLASSDAWVVVTEEVGKVMIGPNEACGGRRLAGTTKGARPLAGECGNVRFLDILYCGLYLVQGITSHYHPSQNPTHQNLPRRPEPRSSFSQPRTLSPSTSLRSRPISLEL